MTKCSSLPKCSYEGGEKARDFKEGRRNRWAGPQISSPPFHTCNVSIALPLRSKQPFSYFSHPLSPEVPRMFGSLKMLICSTWAMLHVPKRMNWDPEYRKEYRMRQNRIKISLLKVSAYHCCITGAQKPQIYDSQPYEFTFPRDWSKENLWRNKKRPGRGPGKEKKKGGSGVNQEVCPP